MRPKGCLCMAAIDGRMAVCPVDPMVDAPMISAMHNDFELSLAVRGCHPNSSHPNNRTTEHPIGPERGHCMATTDGRMAVCPVGPMNDER